MKQFITSISLLAIITVLATPSYGSRTEPYQAKKDTKIQENARSILPKKRKSCVTRLFTCFHCTNDEAGSTPDDNSTPVTNNSSTAANPDGADTPLSAATSTSMEAVLAIGSNNTQSEESDNSLLPDLSKGTIGSASTNTAPITLPAADEERHLNSPRPPAPTTEETQLDK